MTFDSSPAPAGPAPGMPIPGGSLSRVARLNWRLIAAITVAVAGLAWIAAAMQPERYRASALAAIAPMGEGLQASEVLRGVEVLERRTVIATIAALAEMPSTRTRAAAAGGYDIRAAVLPNTSLFRVDVEGTNATEAAAIANRVPQIVGEQARAMFRYYGVTMVSPAVAPSSAFNPRPGRALLAGLLIGLFLGVLAAYVSAWRAARRGLQV